MMNNNRYIDGCIPGLDEHGQRLDQEFQGSGGDIYKILYGEDLCIVKIPNKRSYNDDISRLDDEVSLMHRQLQNDIDETRAFVRTEL